MSLKKAMIVIERGKKPKKTVQVLFNPNQYTINAQNKFREHHIPGLNSPILQFINGEKKTLGMELFFDTYAEKNDVRDYTKEITELLDVESDLHVPPICTFLWGKVKFRGALESVKQEFTMFLPSGTPVRAKLTVTFVEAIGIISQTQKMSLQSADRTKQKILKQNEQLWMIADEEYEEPEKWREIAKANNIDNPRILKTGTTITIPRLD